MMDAFESGLALAERIRRRELSCVDALEFYLERAQRHNAALNAIADDVAGIESVTAGAPAVARLIVNAVRAGGESGAWIHVGNYAASRRLAINTVNLCAVEGRLRGDDQLRP